MGEAPHDRGGRRGGLGVSGGQTTDDRGRILLSSTLSLVFVLLFCPPSSVLCPLSSFPEQLMNRTTPPFRADHVGSLLRPKALHEARAQRAKGEISAGQLKAVEDREIERVIQQQEAVGLQAITDGEFRRSWWHLDFLWGLDGVGKTVMDAGVAFSGGRTRNEGVKVTGKLGMAGPHPMVEHFKFVQAHTGRTPKITIPAPSAIYGRPISTPIDKAAYPAMDAFWNDLGQAYRRAVRGFADAGCRYLQLDEVFIAMLCDPKYRDQMTKRGDDPEKLGPLYGDLINTAMSDIPSDMTITMHLCRGNYKSTFMGAGGYEAEAEVLFNRINVHGYFMEYDTERAGGFEPLRLLPKGKQVVLGLVTTKSGKLETKDELKRRIDQAAKFADLDQLCLSGQCGFASTEEGNTLTEDEQWAKLRLIVEVADEVWGR
jgi:methionine synthase II (cobalamin-independent)